MTLGLYLYFYFFGQNEFKNAYKIFLTSNKCFYKVFDELAKGHFKPMSNFDIKSI